MERLFDTEPYEQPPTTPESVSQYIPGTIELLSHREILEVCDNLHDRGVTWLALELYEQWEDGEDVRKYLGGMGF